MSVSLATPVERLSRVGQSAGKQLKRLGIETVKDLIFYFPFRYEDLRARKTIAELEDGETVTVRAVLKKISQRKSPKRRLVLTQATVYDETGELNVIWFQQPHIIKNLAGGDEVFLAGKVKKTLYGRQMQSPVYEKISRFTEAHGSMHTNRLVPVYPTTGGLTQKMMRFMQKCAEPLYEELADSLPEEIMERQDLVSLITAIKGLHFPETDEEVEIAVKRLKFEEIFSYLLIVNKTKEQWGARKALALKPMTDKINEFIASLPYELTGDQLSVILAMQGDLQSEIAANRLLEGDVGAGKTVVAAAALLIAALNKHQGALLAPTEILAEQHYRSLREMYERQNVKVGLLTGSRRSIDGETVERETVLSALQDGYLDVMIGTHALIQEKVMFKSLQLAVIDEQHRFGVRQRKLLLDKSTGKLSPHLLSLTATPIPRTLALTLYGDLEVSRLKQKPAGRKPIKTKIVRSVNIEHVHKFMRQELVKGRQIYVMCPLIDPSDTLGAASVKDELEKLTAVFKEYEVAALHGKLKPRDKDAIMKRFNDNEINLLVTTSVVEVGVNVPNASVMMILGAERFGLAQLHQFRGRVGRAEHQSYCFLVTESWRPETVARLKFMETCDDGFELAEKDLSWRGAGDLYGERQSGLPTFKFATLSDVRLFELAREEAEKLLKTDRELDDYPLLKEKVKQQLDAVHGE